MPRAGRWLWEARRSGSDGSNDVQDLSTVGHVVVVGSPYHNVFEGCLQQYVNFYLNFVDTDLLCLGGLSL